MHLLEPNRPVVLSGASGLLGKALRRALAYNGFAALQLVRGKAGHTGQLAWNPAGMPAFEHPERLENCAAAINLSGASIAGGRWTAPVRNELVRSRVGTTATLCGALAALKQPPRTLIVASAIGIYGNRGDEVLDESSSPGEGFLAGLCRAWEASAQPAAKAGIRVVHARFGVVLSREGGALRKMLPVFRLGLGGRLGSGRQWMSWISLEDAVDALLFLLGREDISGPVNVTAPAAATNAEFTRSLATHLNRPAVLPAPAFALRMAFGAMADEALLASQKAAPLKLMEAGFRFRLPSLEDALRASLEDGNC